MRTRVRVTDTSRLTLVFWGPEEEEEEEEAEEAEVSYKTTHVRMRRTHEDLVFDSPLFCACPTEDTSSETEAMETDADQEHRTEKDACQTRKEEPV
jgi:hypothetical protein